MKKFIPFIAIAIILIIDFSIFNDLIGSEKPNLSKSFIVLFSIPLLTLIFAQIKHKSLIALKYSYFWLAGILITSIISFYPAIFASFTNWDDPSYVLQNQLIRNLSFESIKKIFSSTFNGMYQPLTMLSFSIDYYFAKNQAWFYHFINIALHLINTIAVFWLCKMLFKELKIAIIVAFLFAIHPMHVESVAWITERKDLLYSLFFLLSINTYIKYLKEESKIFYFISLALFVFSLFVKSQAVTLALCIIAIDFFLDRKLFSFKVILEKAPFLILAIIFGIFTIYFSEGEETQYSVFEKFIYAGYGYFIYIFKLIIPINLSAIYPYPDQIPFYYYILTALSLGILSSIIYFYKKDKLLTFGLLFFTINIVLLLQFFPNTYSIISDRYSYISSIGIFVLIAYLYLFIEKKKRKILLTTKVILSVYILVLSVACINRTKVWENSFSLWDDTIKKHKNSPEAWSNRAYAFFEMKEYQKALNDYNKAIRLDSKNYQFYLNRGITFTQARDYKNAIQDYNKALTLAPDNAELYLNRGNVKNFQGKPEEAIKDFNIAIEKDRNNPKTWLSRGAINANLGKHNDAISDFNIVINLSPLDPVAYMNRGLSFARQGDFRNAIVDFNKSIEIEPKLAQSYINRGFSYYNQQNYHAAIKDYNKALTLNPNSAIVFMNRGRALIKLERFNEACNDLNNAYNLGIKDAQALMQLYCN
ncbi:MAG: tetratricopeptide repeat protein [Bacteroidetes bacterium]|nr:tetratricopeptide repeat protein [Bacteroidota bacterium]MBT6686776.1 tetratricopeptide repeat protein [Bacteroidota bacterium]MBT7141985.1 tetratricopeptide repeat protein [Bacteroidota bacterium]MBT7492505.1 tetratricopeptide repeat protein [Bacteroidota bacterium]